MEFSRQEYWSGLPFPSQGGSFRPGIEPRFPVLQADSLLSEPPGKSSMQFLIVLNWHMRSSSLTRGRTQAPCIGSTVLATGPPGKSLDISFFNSRSVCSTKCKGPPAPTKHLFTGCPQSLQIIPAKDRRLGEREFSAPFLEYLIPVPITPLYRKHHGSFWMVTCLLLSHHSPIPGQMVSFLVSLFYRTFSFLLCSSLYCWSLPPAQSASCLIIVSKPAVAERIHFLLFGPWKMVTRAVELMLQEKNMKFFFILLFSASRSLRLP